jgi:hypothetical protein
VIDFSSYWDFGLESLPVHVLCRPRSLAMGLNPFRGSYKISYRFTVPDINYGLEQAEGLNLSKKKKRGRRNCGIDRFRIEPFRRISYVNSQQMRFTGSKGNKQNETDRQTDIQRDRKKPFGPIHSTECQVTPVCPKFQTRQANPSFSHTPSESPFYCVPNGGRTSSSLVPKL